MAHDAGPNDPIVLQWLPWVATSERAQLQRDASGTGRPAVVNSFATESGEAQTRHALSFLAWGSRLMQVSCLMHATTCRGERMEGWRLRLSVAKSRTTDAVGRVLTLRQLSKQAPANGSLVMSVCHVTGCHAFITRP